MHRLSLIILSFITVSCFGQEYATNFLIMDTCGSRMNHNDAGSPESSLVGVRY